MARLTIELNDYNLAPGHARQMWVGSAFAFIAPNPTEDVVQEGLNNFYGTSSPASRRTLSLLPDGKAFPGFKVKPTERPLKLAPVLLTDKEIYRAGQDNVRLLVVAPAWLVGPAQAARLVIENNGAIYRNQAVTLATGGLTLVELGQLPEGGYRVYWDADEAADYEGKKAECRFSSVEYVLSPLQATLLAHQLDGKKLECRLKVESFNEPLNVPVEIELWSGNQRLAQERRVKPGTPGIYNIEFKVKASANERLELRVSHLDQTATVVIPGSAKAERDETLLSGLGREVRASLMPGQTTREVRGLYLSADSTVKNTPVTITDPAPTSGKAQLRWQGAAQAARLLVLDAQNKLIEDRDLGDVTAGQIVEIETVAPGAFIAVGGWLDGKAWEGWSFVMAPSRAQLNIISPTTARPGRSVDLQLETGSTASVYLLVRDSRLVGATPKERLAASLKRGLEGVNKWATLGFIKQTLDQHPDWPSDYYSFSRPGTGALPRMPLPPPMGLTTLSGPPTGIVRPMMAAPQAGSFFAFTSAEVSMTSAAAPMLYVANFLSEGTIEAEGDLLGEAAKTADPRRDFADVAYCAVVQTNPQGRASLSFQLPDAITSYSIEAFALTEGGLDWGAARESLEVTQPVWAEFKLPAFVYPGDVSAASLEVGCKSGQFRLRLLRDGTPVPFTLSGAKQIAPDSYSGQRAKVTFEAQSGLWRAELEDLTTGEQDASERTVEALGHFKGLARRFQLLLTGQTIIRETAGAIQLRLLPSLDKPFSLLCDATADYGHRCCEQTAAKLLAAVAALVSGSGDGGKLNDVILAGVARERRMFLPGQGFMMYPPEESGGNRQPNEYWGKLAAEHLSNLALVGGSLFVPGASSFEPSVKQALQEAMQMGEDAAKAYKLPLTPNRVDSGREAYRALARKASVRGEALGYARRSLREQGRNQGAVLAREEQAYCAAALLLGGDPSDIGLAIEAANRLASSLGSEGRLYSTVDSVALISLMGALRMAGIGASGTGRVRLDGRELSLQEAIEAASDGQAKEVTTLEGAALVELTTEVVEDWNAFRATVPVGVNLNRVGKLGQTALRLGDTVELIVTIQQYEPGLLTHVCLPPALSKIEGGGEVKKFSVDFAGRTELRIPLRATGYTGPQGEHWAILVRNMFNEEQAGNPGLLTAQVSPE